MPWRATATPRPMKEKRWNNPFASFSKQSTNPSQEIDTQDPVAEQACRRHSVLLKAERDLVVIGGHAEFDSALVIGGNGCVEVELLEWDCALPAIHVQ